MEFLFWFKKLSVLWRVHTLSYGCKIWGDITSGIQTNISSLPNWDDKLLFIQYNAYSTLILWNAFVYRQLVFCDSHLLSKCPLFNWTQTFLVVNAYIHTRQQRAKTHLAQYCEWILCINSRKSILTSKRCEILWTKNAVDLAWLCGQITYIVLNALCYVVRYNESKTYKVDIMCLHINKYITYNTYTDSIAYDFGHDTDIHRKKQKKNQFGSTVDCVLCAC